MERIEDYERIDVVRDGPVLRIWLDRADKRNAHDRRMLEEVAEAFTAASSDFEARVVVLGGRGPTFCAGADRRERVAPGRSAREDRHRNQLGRRVTRAIEECEVPTLARVHGHASGGGSCLAVSCDFRITSESAKWWVPEVELGTPLPWAGTPRLIAEIGMARARRYVMLSERVDGPTAVDWGLAHACVPDDELDDEVERWVDRLVSLPELAVTMAKAHFRGYGRGAVLGDLSETDGDLSAIVQTTDDFKERFAGF